MTAIVLVRLVHVLCAVLGVGAVAAVAVAARRAARTPAAIDDAALAALARWASLGLGGVFLTGIALDFLSGGTLHERWWFRLSGLSTIVLGALLGRTRALLRRVAKGERPRDATLGTVAILAYAASALVAWIVVLMELQPFG